VGTLGCARSYRRRADGSCRTGEGLGSTLGQGALVLDVERSSSSWGRLRAFGVVRSKGGAREGALELEPAGAGVRGAAGRREESECVSMTLGSCCSLVEGGEGGGGRGGGTGVVGSRSVPQRGNQPGRAVSVTGRVVFIAIGTSGWRGNTTVENGL